MSGDPPRKKPKFDADSDPDDDSQEVPDCSLESDAYALIVQLEDEFSELDVGSIGDAFASLDSDPDDDDDEPPNTLLESDPYTLIQLEEVIAELNVGSIGNSIAGVIADDFDLSVSRQEELSFEPLADHDGIAMSSFVRSLLDVDWEEALLSSQNRGALAFAYIENVINEVSEIILEAYGDYLQVIALHDSTNFAKLRSILPDASDLLDAVIRQLIDLAERRDPRVRMILPMDQSPDPRTSQSNQSTAVLQQVRSLSIGKKRGGYKCCKCGAPMKGHSCNLPDMHCPGLFSGHDGRKWNIRLAENVIKEMNDAAKEKWVDVPPEEQQCDKQSKKRQNYNCDFCKNHKTSKFHKKYCIYRPGTKISLGADGKTSYHATPAGRASNSKADAKDRGENEVRLELGDFVLLDNDEEDDEDDKKPSAIDMDRKSGGDGGKGDDKDDSNGDASGDWDTDGGFAGVTSHPV